LFLLGCAQALYDKAQVNEDKCTVTRTCAALNTARCRLCGKISACKLTLASQIKGKLNGNDVRTEYHKANSVFPKKVESISDQ